MEDLLKVESFIIPGGLIRPPHGDDPPWAYVIGNSSTWETSSSWKAPMKAAPRFSARAVNNRFMEPKAVSIKL